MFPVVDVARGEHVAPRLQGVFPNNTQFAARRELPSKSEVDTPSIEIYIVLRGVVRIEIDKLSFMEFRVLFGITTIVHSDLISISLTSFLFSFSKRVATSIGN